VSFGINTREWYGGRVPLAVNTILLGRQTITRSNFLVCFWFSTLTLIGLAVLPTWLVVKDINPEDIAMDSDATTQNHDSPPQSALDEKLAT